jgi:carbon storage regulator
MLVLSRKRLEQIVIGSEIRITIVKLEGTQVRLGIEAPEHLMVLRAELRDGASPPGMTSVPSEASPRAGRSRPLRRGPQRQKAGPPDGAAC